MNGNRWVTVDPDLFVEKDDGTCDLPKAIYEQRTTNTQAHSSVPTAHVEPDSNNESLGTSKTPQVAIPCHLHLHSVRRRLADSDGICGKYIIDGLIHAGILSNDSPKEVTETRFSQEKGTKEKTIISIYGAV